MLADYTEAIGLNPNNVDSFVHRAKAYRALGDDAKAANDKLAAEELRM